MLLETKRGKPNKVPIADAAIHAQGHHTWSGAQDAGGNVIGYQPEDYKHQEFPRLVYKPRQTAKFVADQIAKQVLGAKKPAERQALYLEAVHKLGELGADVREFPMQVPDEAVLRSFVGIIGAKLAAQEKQDWLANNGEKTPDDFKKWSETPESLEVKNSAELKKAIADGWFLTPDCKVAAVAAA